MRKPIYSLLITGVALCLAGPLQAADKQDQNDISRDRFEQKVQTVNNTANKPGQMKVALERISTETGVPAEQVQSLHKKYPGTGAAGILSSCVMAAETKKSPESFLKQRANGKSWSALAKDNNVSIEKLNDRLDNLQRSLSNGEAGK